MQIFCVLFFFFLPWVFITIIIMTRFYKNWNVCNARRAGYTCSLVFPFPFKTLAVTQNVLQVHRFEFQRVVVLKCKYNVVRREKM